jgi:MoaD family protein
MNERPPVNDAQDHITLTVKSFATFREVMDAQSRMEFPKGATIRMLLSELTGRYEGLGELMFAAPDTLRDFVNILRNGRNIHFLAGLDTQLDDGDVIALFPPVAGG